MPPKSTIKRLPQPLRKELDRLLGDGRFTLNQIVEHMSQLGAEVSRSAVGRYSQEFEEISAKLRESRELASRFAQELGDLPDNDLGRLLPDMLHTLIMRSMRPMLRGGEDAIEVKELMMLARTLRDCIGAAKTSADMELRIKEHVRKELLAEMDTKLDAAERAKGITPELAAQIRRTILFGEAR